MVSIGERMRTLMIPLRTLTLLCRTARAHCAPSPAINYWLVATRLFKVIFYDTCALFAVMKKIPYTMEK
jgi:hypothetical protein